MFLAKGQLNKLFPVLQASVLLAFFWPLFACWTAKPALKYNEQGGEDFGVEAPEIH